MERIYRSLNKGGYLVIVDFIMDEKREKANHALNNMVYHLLNSWEGDNRSESELKSFLEDFGFKNFNCIYNMELPCIVNCQK